MSANLRCQIPSEPFFSARPKEVREAKALCAGCPLHDECRELGWSEEHGVWGGLSAIDRKKADRARYDRAVVAAEGFSDRVDDHIVKERIDPWEQGEARRWASWDDVWERGPGERDVRV